MAKFGHGGLRGFGTTRILGASTLDHGDRQPLARRNRVLGMTVAAETRAAARAHPFLHAALRAGIVNYTAAARFLDVGETDAVAAALRRYAEELDDPEEIDRRASVSMRSGIGRTADEEGIVSVGEETFAEGNGDLTAIVATGEVDAGALASVLGRLRTADVAIVATAASEGMLAVVVDQRAGPDAVRAVEQAL
jgi:hypothetical protein